MFEDFMGFIGSGFEGLIKFAQDVLTGQSTSINAIWDGVSNIGGGIIMTIATQILVICMLLELIQVAQRFDTVTFEKGTKIMTKFILAKLAIEQAPNLLRGIFETVNIIITNISSAGFSGATFHEAETIWSVILDNYNSLGFLEKIPAQLLMFVVGIVLLVCGIILVLTAYGRMFEILVYCFICPIPIAFLPIGNGDGSGFSSVTMGFFKYFAAACLQGVIMLGCIRIFHTINVASAVEVAGIGDGDYWSSVLTLLITSFALVAAVKQSGTFAKNALGISG